MVRERRRERERDEGRQRERGQERDGERGREGKSEMGIDRYGGKERDWKKTEGKRKTETDRMGRW